jgi:phosphoribosyl-AMP cyclohydrolase
MNDSLNLSGIHFNETGLIPAIVQSAQSRKVLMMAWMNEEAIRRTLETRQTVFFSRSRQELWHKGATSGNVQKLVGMDLDCDGDALLINVIEEGPACHTGLASCFDTHSIFRSSELSA